MADQESLGELLRRHRIGVGLTLEQLAEASGVSGRTISDVERGISRAPRARTVAALADGLRLDPAERSELLAAARAGRRRAAAPEPAAAPGSAMPRGLPDFTGRRRELDAIVGWAGGARVGEPAPVVLVTGSPGLGKTSLAVRAAGELAGSLPDGQFFVDLRGLDARPLPTATVLDRLIRALEPSTGAVPRQVEEASAVWRSMIRGRRIVVLLDNAAHESQVRPVLPSEGPAVVLVTSRRGLTGLEGVHRIMLEPLPDEAAVDLLAGIATDRVEAAGLRRLARLCANVPLALRIAGNRLSTRPGWTVDDLADRLDRQERRLDVLTEGDLEVRAAFALSHQQLSEAARRLFRRLALVPGPSTSVELAAVLADETPPDAEDRLDELLDLTLVQQRSDGRFTSHDLLKLYAGEELVAAEDAAGRADAERRMRDWLLDTTIVAGRWYEPAFGAPAPGATRWVELDTAEAARRWLQAEAENWVPALRQTAEAGEHRRVVDVAESLHWFSDLWANSGYWQEVYTLSAEAADALADDRLRAVHRGYLAWVYNEPLNEPEEGYRQAVLAYEHARRAGDLGQQGWARMYAAWAQWQLGGHEEQLALSQEAVALFRAAGDREGLPQALMERGKALARLGRSAEAIATYTEMIGVVSSPETAPAPTLARLAMVAAYGGIGRIHLEAGRWEQSIEFSDQALRFARETGHREQAAVMLTRRAEARVHLGDLLAAVADLREALDLQRDAGDERGQRATRERLEQLLGR
ncbi:ATP-binding protein [Micromonospora humi]|uniref:NB-ARC domain-containing protein n=1 Tax=Micromonospora humi TaxID=745366 RepID=A0A1C5JNE6_9ACTN|nr:helix-turn-helix domain-containing protein [Micromonospora humi]SCG72090.1 NB-ARC domain-containing protein [Micromonospora humi]